jgi:hypothetical protein
MFLSKDTAASSRVLNRQILTQPMRRTVRQVSRLNHRTFNPAAHADHSSASGYSLNCERPSGGMGKRWTPSAFNATLFPLTSGSLPRPLAAERPRGFFFGGREIFVWVLLAAVTSTSPCSPIGNSTAGTRSRSDRVDDTLPDERASVLSQSELARSTEPVGRVFK